MKIEKSVLIKKYPRLFGTPKHRGSEKITGLKFNCPDSWLEDLAILFEKINAIVLAERLYTFKIIQVKEQNDTLRIYFQNANDDINSLIREAEYKIDSL